MGSNGADGNNLRRMNTLSGVDCTWLLSNEVRRQQIIQDLCPSVKEMEDADLRINFLGYFWKDWSLIDSANYSALRGLDIRQEKPWKIGDPVGVTSLDEHWVTLIAFMNALTGS